MRYSPSTDAGWSLGVAACLFLGCGVGKPVAAEPVPAAEVLEFSVNEAEESTAAASVAAADDTVVEAFDWRDDLYGPMVADGQTVHVRAVSANHHSAAQRCERTCRQCVNTGPQWYLAGIIGPSFGTLTNESLPAVNESLFTAGGAIGVDLAPAKAGWRFDFEARYRDPLAESADLGGLPVDVRAEQLWSTLINAYRDMELTDTLDLYLVAGIGAGGYQTSYAGSDPILNVEVAGNRGLTSFAWQAGTGVAWRLSPRVTVDVGYRFFEVAGGTTAVTSSQSGVVLNTSDIASAFSAGEVLFSLRMYEPFRGWR